MPQNPRRQLTGLAARMLLSAAALLLASASPGAADPGAAAAPSNPETVTRSQDRYARDGFIRGLSLEAGRRPVSASHLAEVAATGVEWVAQIPFGFLGAADDPEIRMPWARRVMWAESDEGIRRTTALAHEHGLHVMLKPQLWIRRGTWVGEIAMHSEADWERWFASYTEYIVHFAEVAQELGIELFAVGTELQGTVQREAEWRRLIAAVREVYDGPLTYSANWHDGYRSVPWWDAVDYVGVSAYFPLHVADEIIEAGDREAASRAILEAWEPHRAELAELARRVGKPLIFTEAGYRSLKGTLREPWEWRGRGQADLAVQELAYDALLTTFWGEPWFHGLFFWNWSIDDQGGPGDRGYTPRNKPASAVMARWFERER